MNLIGIHGKAQHGKDTVARIIQYYTSKNEPICSLERYLEQRKQGWSSQSNWETRSFADKLKQVVSLITGVSISYLNKDEFKSKVMSPEWSCWRLSFYAEHNDIGHLIWKTFISEDEARDYMDDNYIVGGKLEVFIPTYREFLQIIGTDLFRERLHPNTWITSTFLEYNPSYENNPWYQNKGIYDVSENDEVSNPPLYPKWIITDVRFPNEYAEILDRDGIVIKVVREGIQQSYHSSETALDNHKFEYTLFNDQDIPYLAQQVKTMLKKYSIPFRDI